MYQYMHACICVCDAWYIYTHNQKVCIPENQPPEPLAATSFFTPMGLCGDGRWFSHLGLKDPESIVVGDKQVGIYYW